MNAWIEGTSRAGCVEIREFPTDAGLVPSNDNAECQVCERLYLRGRAGVQQRTEQSLKYS